jgi:Iodothyronine deiodinase
MEAIYHHYREHVEFFVIYVQEAHPTDGWQTDSNVAEGVLFRQHQSYEERESVAATCSLDQHLSLPVLIEEMDNAIDEAYGAAPERLYLIGADGRVAYRGGAGPHFFDLDEWEHAIAACVSSATV